MSIDKVLAGSFGKTRKQMDEKFFWDIKEALDQERVLNTNKYSAVIVNKEIQTFVDIMDYDLGDTIETELIQKAIERIDGRHKNPYEHDKAVAKKIRDFIDDSFDNLEKQHNEGEILSIIKGEMGVKEYLNRNVDDSGLDEHIVHFTTEKVRKDELEQ